MRVPIGRRYIEFLQVKTTKVSIGERFESPFGITFEILGAPIFSGTLKIIELVAGVRTRNRRSGLVGTWTVSGNTRLLLFAKCPDT